MNSADGVVYVIRDFEKDVVVTKEEWDATAHRSAASCMEKAIPPVMRYAIGVVIYCIVARILFEIGTFFSSKFNLSIGFYFLILLAVIILSVAITHNTCKVIFNTKIAEKIRRR